jgi:hypothetical protein
MKFIKLNENIGFSVSDGKIFAGNWLFLKLKTQNAAMLKKIC